ncbi:Hypothetical predicted protein [Podarcis lilfordi]|uniref:Fibrinogen C-terminal domain-containing protein n=1 Tax=Podarcis lilfordi TaxID=74358 RepID=A0AA35PPJ1_9SAUR|nr:Hypothetical predicted protein [Podarcis lilfordi]
MNLSCCCNPYLTELEKQVSLSGVRQTSVIENKDCTSISFLPDFFQIRRRTLEQSAPTHGKQVFPRWSDGSVDFDQDWDSWKRAFGSQLTQFWLGKTTFTC